MASELATRALADEQAALRRIATLVASEAPPSSVFEQRHRGGRAPARRARAPACCATRTTCTRRWSAAGATPGLTGLPLGSSRRPRRRLGRRPRLPQRPSGAHRRLRRRAGSARGAPARARLPLVGGRSRLRRRQAVGRAGRLDHESERLVSRLRAAAVATSPSSWRRPCPTPTPTTSSPARARASSRPATPSAGGWSATSTTAPSSGSCRSRCSCAWSRASFEANPGACPPGSRRGSRAAQARARGAARAGPRHPSRDPHRRRPGPRPLGARPPRAAAGRDRRRCPTSACPSPSRPPPTTSSPRRSPTSPSTPTRPTSPSACCRDDGRVLVRVADDGIGGADPGGRLGPPRSRRPRRGAPRAPSRRQPTRRRHAPGGAHPGRMRARWWWAGGLALATASLALPSAPTYDPWAWIVFGREIACRGRTSAPSRAPAGSRSRCSSPRRWPSPAPRRRASGSWSCGSRVSRRSLLAFRLGTRAGGRVAGMLAVLALLASSDWLRYLSAGNVEPLVVALVLGAIELHLRGRRQGAFVLGALAGLARPEVWLLVAAYAAYVSLTERRWWPLALGVPAMFALWIVPDWLGSGDLLAHVPSRPHQRRADQPAGYGRPRAGAPARRGHDRAGAGLDRGPVRPGLRLAHPRSHGGRARLRGGRMDPDHRRRHRRSGTRRCPATSSCRRPSAACSPGSGSSASCAWRPAPAAGRCWRRPSSR